MVIINKKGVELSLQTIIIFIILVIVLLVIIYFFTGNFFKGSENIGNIGENIINGK